MKEIHVELEAALECATSPPRQGTLEQASEFERRNYSSWVGDFGPPHTVPKRDCDCEERQASILYIVHLVVQVLQVKVGRS